MPTKGLQRIMFLQMLEIVTGGLVHISSEELNPSLLMILTDLKNMTIRIFLMMKENKAEIEEEIEEEIEKKELRPAILPVRKNHANW